MTQAGSRGGRVVTSHSSARWVSARGKSSREKRLGVLLGGSLDSLC